MLLVKIANVFSGQFVTERKDSLFNNVSIIKARLYILLSIHITFTVLPTSTFFFTILVTVAFSIVASEVCLTDI